jgi:nitrogen-specific signal transduction histidine kinase
VTHFWETLATVCVSGGGVAAVVVPIMGARQRRRERDAERIREAVDKARVMEESARKHETAASIHDSVDRAMSGFRNDVIARIEQSDHKSDEGRRILSSKIEELQARAEQTDRKVTEVKLQFGPNGGGLRQRADETHAAVTRLEAAQSGLVARFEDHLTQSNLDREQLHEIQTKMMNPR